MKRLYANLGIHSNDKAFHLIPLEIINNYNQMKNTSIPTGCRNNSRQSIVPNDILYLKGAINYTYVYLTNGDRLLVCTTLKILEGRLRESGFLRTSKSFLINLDCVKSYRSVADRGKIELLNNHVVEVSRRKNKLLKTLFDTRPVGLS